MSAPDLQDETYKDLGVLGWWYELVEFALNVASKEDSDQCARKSWQYNTFSDDGMYRFSLKAANHNCMIKD